MIFGFNTDIKHNETVYHVQSEAREADYLLQTQVFVRGRCIGKFARSYAEARQQPGFSDDSMHELLKTQHRSTIEAVRAGGIEQYLAESAESSKASEAALSNGKASHDFEMEFLNPDNVADDDGLVLRFRVRESGANIHGAKLISKASSPTKPQPIFAQSITGIDGIGEIRIGLSRDEASELNVLTQATYDGRTITRKIVLRSAK
jgi:hypothetical protein